MNDLVARHTRRLRLVWAGFLASLAAYSGLVVAPTTPRLPALPQAQPLLWGFGFLAAANLVTVMPTYRAMLAGPSRVFAVGRQLDRLLKAHFAAYLVALARVEAVSVLGLVVLFLTGRRDWFWTSTGIAAVGIALLWPSRKKVAALAAAPGTASLDTPTC